METLKRKASSALAPGKTSITLRRGKLPAWERRLLKRIGQDPAVPVVIDLDWNKVDARDPYAMRPGGHEIIGLSRIAVWLNVDVKQLGNLKNPKHSSYDPEVAGAIEKRGGRYVAESSQLFVVLLNRQTRTSRKRSFLTKARLSTAQKTPTRSK